MILQPTIRLTWDELDDAVQKQYVGRYNTFETKNENNWDFSLFLNNTSVSYEEKCEILRKIVESSPYHPYAFENYHTDEDGIWIELSASTELRVPVSVQSILTKINSLSEVSQDLTNSLKQVRGSAGLTGIEKDSRPSVQMLNKALLENEQLLEKFCNTIVNFPVDLIS